MQEISRKNKYWIAGLFLMIAVLTWLSIIFVGKSSYIDEPYHARQIQRFVKGNYDLVSQLTTIPGYHLTIAMVAKMLNTPGIKQLRLISLVFSLISIWVFFLLTKKLDAKNPLLKTLQYVFLPISFLYFPLVYTDIFSLLLVITAFYFAISKRYSISAFFSLAALLVRQNNITWIVFFWVYTYILENGFSFSWKKILEHIRRGAGYIVAAILFVIFVWFNGGVAIGDQGRQQAGFYMGNIYFFLAVMGVLFLPSIIASISREIKHNIFKKRIIFGVLAGVIMACLFLFFRPTLHEYNLASGFLRNSILQLAYQQYAWAYALAIFFGCLALSLMKFEKKSLLLLPFVTAYLMPSWLVEQRYLIIPLVFVLLFRKETNSKIEYVNMLYFILLSIGLAYMVLKIGIFF